MATIAAGDLPLSATLTDDDRFMIIDAPGSTKAAKLVATTVVRASMQSGAVLTTSLGAANGVATLGADSKLTASQVPAIVAGVTSVNGLTGVVSGLEQTSKKGVVSGYAPLDTNAKVPTINLPGTVQSASRNNNASVSQVVDFNYEQNVILLDQDATITFSNLQAGAKTTLVLRQDGTGGRNVAFPGVNFAWDSVTGVVAPYASQQSIIGLEVMEDAVTVAAYGAALDGSEVYRLFTGQETYSRDQLLSGGFGSVMNAGNIYFTYFRAKKTQQVISLNTWCVTASIGATHQYMALCDVNVANWTTSILAITADAAGNGMFGTSSSIGTAVTANLTAPLTILAGKWYAFAVASIGHSTSPSLVSTRAMSATNVMNMLPYPAGAAPQATYPTVGTSYIWTTNITAFNTLQYGVML